MIFPSAVIRVRRQSEQNGSVTEAMIPTVPRAGLSLSVPRLLTSKISAGGRSLHMGGGEVEIGSEQRPYFVRGNHLALGPSVVCIQGYLLYKPQFLTVG